MARITPHCLTCKVHDCKVMKSCEQDLLQTISSYKHSIEYKKGEALFHEGDEIRGVHFIQSGIVKLEMNGHRNRNFILRLAGSGYALGHRNLNGSRRQPFSAIAVEDTRVCFLDGTHFRNILAPAKALQQELNSSCQQETTDTEHRLLQMAHLSVREKVAVVLIHLADIYQYKPDGMGIRVHLDRQEMADLAGTTKEQVSKILADLTLEKVIRFRAKHFKHMDLAALHSIAEGVAELSPIMN